MPQHRMEFRGISMESGPSLIPHLHGQQMGDRAQLLSLCNKCLLSTDPSCWPQDTVLVLKENICANTEFTLLCM